MSAAYIKEILLDYSLNRLPLDIKIDITCAIENAIKADILKKYDIFVLDLYLRGYTVNQIANNTYVWYLPNPFSSNAYIQASLEHTFLAIAEFSGYTDEWFIEQLQGNMSNHRIQRAQIYLEYYGKDYTIHDTQERIEEYEYTTV